MKKINELIEIFKEVFEGEYYIQLGSVQYTIENTFTFIEKNNFTFKSIHSKLIKLN